MKNESTGTVQVASLRNLVPTKVTIDQTRSHIKQKQLRFFD